MIPSLQPNRPKITPPQPHSSTTPLYQQQQRRTTTTSTSAPTTQPPRNTTTTTTTARAPAPSFAPPTTNPKSQIEAMPPSQAFSPTATKAPTTPTAYNATSLPYNPALRHPVFFTERWRRVAPFHSSSSSVAHVQSSSSGTGVSPVAVGYEWARGMVDRGPKL